MITAILAAAAVTVAPVPPEKAGQVHQAGPLATDIALGARGAAKFAPFVIGTKAQLDANLLDFPTARFRGVTIGYRDGKRVMCGFYNARNRMGAYVGWQPFYAFGVDYPELHLLDDDNPTTYGYRYHCGGLTAWLAGDYSTIIGATGQ